MESIRGRTAHRPGKEPHIFNETAAAAPIRAAALFSPGSPGECRVGHKTFSPCGMRHNIDPYGRVVVVNLKIRTAIGVKGRRPLRHPKCSRRTDDFDRAERKREPPTRRICRRWVPISVFPQRSRARPCRTARSRRTRDRIRRSASPYARNRERTTRSWRSA